MVDIDTIDLPANSRPIHRSESLTSLISAKSIQNKVFLLLTTKNSFLNKMSTTEINI